MYVLFHQAHGSATQQVALQWQAYSSCLLLVFFFVAEDCQQRSSWRYALWICDLTHVHDDGLFEGVRWRPPCIITDLLIARLDIYKPRNQRLYGLRLGQRTISTLCAQVYNMANTPHMPLDIKAREIRLLTIFPSTQPSELIRCALKAIPLKNAVKEYQALSYVWGVTSDTVSLDIDGSETCITRSLDTALRHVRHHSDPVVLWVDGVCINQTDPQERSHQVTMMADIHKSALSVLVWLGPGSHDSQLAFRLIQNISSTGNDSQSDALRRLQLQFDAEDCRENAQALYSGQLCEEQRAAIEADFAELAKDVSLPFSSPEEATALDNLFSRSWWTRVWTLQEVILNSSVTYKCGDDEATEEDLFQAANVWMEIRGRDPRHQISKWNPLTIVETKEDLGKSEIIYQKATENEPPWAFQLLKLVKNYHSQQSGQPVDRIYGLLGLASNADQHSQPDYSKSTEYVFTDFAVECLSLYKSLHFLIKAGISSPKGQHLDLPSWVQNWTQGQSLPVFLGDGMAFENAGIGQTAILPSVSEDMMTLHAKGILYDAVSSNKSVPQFGMVGDCYWEDMLPSRHLPPYRLRGHSLTQLATLFRAIVLDLGIPREDGSLGPGRMPMQGEERLFRMLTAFLRELATAQGQLDKDLCDVFLRWIGEEKDGRPAEGILELLLNKDRASSYIQWYRQEVAYSRKLGHDVLDNLKAPGF